MFSAVDMLLQYYRLVVLSTTADNLHLIIMNSRADEQVLSRGISRNLDAHIPQPVLHVSVLTNRGARLGHIWNAGILQISCSNP
jgi:hypothetical protein